MKHLFLFLLFLLPVLLSAQDPLPANPRKLRLGYQTDGEGIVLYGSGVPSYTPTRYRSAFHYMDTTNNIYYQYNRIEAKWDTILAGAGAVADGVSVDNSTWSKIGGTDVQQALTKTDSALNNITIDGSQIQNKFEATTTTLTVSADTLAAKQDYTVVVKNSASSAETRVRLPSPSAALQGERLSVVDSSRNGSTTYIEASDSLSIFVDGAPIYRYYLDPGERVDIVQSSSSWVIQPQRERKVKDLYNSRFDYAEKVGQYTITSAIDTNDIDSLFVFPVRAKKSIPYNWLGNTELLTGTSHWNPLSGEIEEGELITGPNGRKNGRIFYASETAVGQIGIRLVTPRDRGISISTSNSYTFSVWIKIISPSTNGLSGVQIDWVADATATEIELNDGVDFSSEKWQFAYGTVQYDGATSDGRIDIQFNGMAPGDSIVLAEPKFEISPVPTQYLPTDDNRVITSFDTLYSIYAIRNSTIKLSELTPIKKMTDSEILQAALDYCKATDGCTEVVVDETIVLTDSIEIPENISLVGGGKSSRLTTVYVNINDASRDAINFIKDEPGDYNENQVIHGLSFVVVSPCRSVIDMRCGIDTKVENISINPGFLNGEGGLAWTDSLHQYGIITGDCDTPDGLDNTIYNVRVTGAWDYGFYLADTKLAYLKDLRALRCNKGVYHDGIEASFESVWIETTHNSGMVLRGNQYHIQDTYFESIGNSSFFGGLPKDPVTYLIDAANAESFDLNDIVITGNVASDLTSYFKFRDNDYIELKNYRGVQSGSVPLADADCSNTSMVVYNWNYADSLRNESWVCQDILNVISALNDEAAESYSRLINADVDKSIVSTSFLDNIRVIDPTLSGIISIDTLVQIDAVGSNRIAFSEPITGVGSGWNDLGVLVVEDGTADVAAPIDDIQGIAKLTWNTDTSLQSTRYRYDLAGIYDFDSTYIFSCWVRPGSKAITRVGIQISDSGTDVFNSLVPDTTGWSRVFVEVKPTDTTVSNPNNRIHVLFYADGFTTTDSAYAAGFSLVKIPISNRRRGVYEPPYIRTTGTSISDVGQAEIQLLDKLNYKGEKTTFDSLQVQTLRDDDGDLGAVGQVFISTGSGTDWIDNNAFDGGEIYILPNDPDTLDFSAAGGLFDQIQDMTIGTLDNFTSSGDTLYYTGSVTRPFTINFTATLEADTGSQELQMRITKNGSSLDKCTVSKDYSTSGVEVQITGTCRLDLSTNDAIALEVSPTQNTSQLLVRRANINLH